MENEISPVLQTTLNALKTRGFDARYAATRAEARKIIAGLVRENWIVGCGDSTTVRSLGIIEELQDMGNRVLNPFFKPKIMREKPAMLPLSVMRQTAQGCEAFLTSANAVTMDGQIVSIDGGGMRVAGMIFGPLLCIIVVGRNKIVKNVDEAFHRIKNVIAPAHAKQTGPTWGIPCADTGKCIEPEIPCVPPKLRICNITVIMEGKPAIPLTEWVVVLVDDDVGLGWDPAWPKERKDKILAEYREFTPPHRPIR